MDVYDMKLHDVNKLSIGWEVVRVPGGWIYSWVDYSLLPADQYGNKDPNNTTHSVFVPYSDQAKEERLEVLLKME